MSVRDVDQNGGGMNPRWLARRLLGASSAEGAASTGVTNVDCTWTIEANPKASLQVKRQQLHSRASAMCLVIRLLVVLLALWGMPLPASAGEHPPETALR